MWPAETSVFVTLVPILAPMITGMAVDTSSAPAATIATVIDVVVDELCTRLVASTPMKSPTNGFAVVMSNRSANPLPNSLIDAPIKLMLTKNT